MEMAEFENREMGFYGNNRQGEEGVVRGDRHMRASDRSKRVGDRGGEEINTVANLNSWFRAVFFKAAPARSPIRQSV